MEWNLVFFINSALLGVGLAMDAFSVSMANGLHEPGMSRSRMFGIAGVFAGFQALMPLLGWICVHTVVQLFEGFTVLIPWIALILLCYIGGKMLLERSLSALQDNMVKVQLVTELPLPEALSLWNGRFFTAYPLTLGTLDPAFSLPVAVLLVQCALLTAGIVLLALPRRRRHVE